MAHVNKANDNNKYTCIIIRKNVHLLHANEIKYNKLIDYYFMLKF